MHGANTVWGKNKCLFNINQESSWLLICLSGMTAIGYFTSNTSLQIPLMEAKILDHDQQKNSSSRYIWAPSPCMLQPTSLSNVQLACAACMQGWFDQGFCFETCSQKADLVSESVFPRINVLKANSLECAKACITSWGNSTFTGTERGALRLPSTWGKDVRSWGPQYVYPNEELRCLSHFEHGGHGMSYHLKVEEVIFIIFIIYHLFPILWGNYMLESSGTHMFIPFWQLRHWHAYPFLKVEDILSLFEKEELIHWSHFFQQSPGDPVKLYNPAVKSPNGFSSTGANPALDLNGFAPRCQDWQRTWWLDVVPRHGHVPWWYGRTGWWMGKWNQWKH